MKKAYLIAASAALLLAGCSSWWPWGYKAPTQAETLQVIKSSFATRGIAAVDRLNQTELQQQCTKHRNDPPKDVRAQLEKSALAAVKYPANSQWLGDWKQGEAIAQRGVGLQFSDDAKTVNGGNCYACHQITKAEISFGNIGPSLYNYGKLRGTTDEIKRYTWAKIWNAHSYNACSSMPRFGDAGILSEEQIRHVMALLLDPASPANQ
jgi:L-cysteine S-thiosulfotransferase